MLRGRLLFDDFNGPESFIIEEVDRKPGVDALA
jgi:hypothetical protein